MYVGSNYCTSCQVFIRATNGIYVYTCMHTCRYVHIHICVYTSCLSSDLYIQIYVRINLYMCTCENYIDWHVQISIYIYMFTYTSVYTYTHTSTYVCTCILAYTNKTLLPAKAEEAMRLGPALDVAHGSPPARNLSMGAAHGSFRAGMR